MFHKGIRTATHTVYNMVHKYPWYIRQSVMYHDPRYWTNKIVVVRNYGGVGNQLTIKLHTTNPPKTARTVSVRAIIFTLRPHFSLDLYHAFWYNTSMIEIKQQYGTWRVAKKARKPGYWICQCVDCGDSGRIVKRTLSERQLKYQARVKCPVCDTIVGTYISGWLVSQRGGSVGKNATFLCQCKHCHRQQRIRADRVKTTKCKDCKGQ